MSRPKKIQEPLPEGLSIDGLCRYYKNGWHIGTLRGYKGPQAQVEPIRGHKSTKTQCIWIPLRDVEEVEEITGSQE